MNVIQVDSETIKKLLQNQASPKQDNAIVAILSQEFLILKKRNASEIELNAWRKSVRDRFTNSGRLLEKVRLGLENERLRLKLMNEFLNGGG